MNEAKQPKEIKYKQVGWIQKTKKTRRKLWKRVTKRSDTKFGNQDGWSCKKSRIKVKQAQRQPWRRN